MSFSSSASSYEAKRQGALTANPVFVNELRQSFVRRRGMHVVVALILAAFFFTLFTQLEGLRNTVVYAPLVLIPLIVPAIGSGAFAKEYEQQTWMDLYLTGLTNAQLVWGKFSAYLVQVVVALVACVPA